MSSEKTMLQCYNRTCGQLFDPDENSEDSCQHHPGVPVFHDAYKKWSCCDKKTTDFTEFLNIKGCTRSYHSNVKPPEPPKPDKEEIKKEQPLPTYKDWIRAVSRPDPSEPMQRLEGRIGESLKQVLERMMEREILENEIVDDNMIAINTPCHNKGCRATYKGEQSVEETCVYHSGIPIFHEGMKYWSCCVKRTTDFDSFLEQVGCTTGKHKWHKDKTANITRCRYDWHQTSNCVIISVYSKGPHPDLSYIEANPVKLHMNISFGNDKSMFEDEVLLYGLISPEESFVTYLGSKVEITLKKAEALRWKDLKYKDVKLTEEA